MKFWTKFALVFSLFFLLLDLVFMFVMTSKCNDMLIPNSICLFKFPPPFLEIILKFILLLLLGIIIGFILQRLLLKNGPKINLPNISPIKLLILLLIIIGSIPLIFIILMLVLPGRERAELVISDQNQDIQSTISNIEESTKLIKGFSISNSNIKKILYINEEDYIKLNSIILNFNIECKSPGLLKIYLNKEMMFNSSDCNKNSIEVDVKNLVIGDNIIEFVLDGENYIINDINIEYH
ncbi:hypothetical protein JXB41_02635 [Candidatus Woesearchaeota archaeon]|nr:hypothetical protein [Candidatus Woesearchaeota archaeon]